MTLRTTALIAGALGLLLFIGGLIADAVRPSEVGEPRASLDTSVVVFEPDILALSPEAILAVEGSGEIAAYIARPVDADAWLASRDVTFVTGVPVWEELAVETQEPAPVEASASPSPSPSASAAASPAASPSASASPSPEAVAQVADIWRQTFTASGTFELPVAQVPVGNTLVVESVDGSPLSAAQLTIPRAIDDAWVTPLTWWGAVLAVIGIIALGSLLFDIRAARGRGESWAASRRASGPARTGGRRHRREELAATGSIPVVSAAHVEDPAAHEGAEAEADEAPEVETAPDVDQVQTGDAQGTDDAPGTDDHDGREQR